MADVIVFSRRPPVVCSEITQVQADRIQALLTDTLNECPACTGRGVLLYKDPVTGLLATAPCPCGGTDEDRIDIDFGGAA